MTIGRVVAPRATGSRPSLPPLPSTADVDAYYSLVDRNRDHLTRHGDYSFAIDATPELIRDQLTEIPRETTAFGIWVGDDLAGRVDLIRHTSKRFGLGYWIGEAFTGRGVATAAIAAAIAYARDQYGATDVFAGVTHGNDRSADLLTRLGFCDVARFDNYPRFHVTLRYDGVQYE